MESGARNRIRLWLRAERAFGLTTVLAPSTSAVASQSLDAIESDEDEVGAETAPFFFGSGETPKPQSESRVKRDEARAGTLPPAGLMPLPSIEPFTAPLLARAEKIERLQALDEREVKGCTRCVLCKTRANTVFGEGDPDARIMFVGEGPGENEDLSGRPFVGRAGELLEKMIVGMGLTREQVFIVNIVKCRPPNNRVPDPVEVATCTPYLERQIEIIRPRVIVTLGLPSAKYMLNDSKLAMGKIRGAWREWRGIKLMPTYHPAFLLRSYTPANRAAVWSDLKMVMAELGMKVPK